jgi:hypothetical protein
MQLIKAGTRGKESMYTGNQLYFKVAGWRENLPDIFPDLNCAQQVALRVTELLSTPQAQRAANSGIASRATSASSSSGGKHYTAYCSDTISISGVGMYHY